MKAVLKTALLSAVFATLTQSGVAKADIWTGFFTGTWTNDSNWFDLSEPGNTDDANFSSGAPVNNTFVNLDSNRTVLSMLVVRASGVADYKFTRTNNALLTVTNQVRIASDGGTLSNSTNFEGFRVNAGGLQVQNNAQLAMTNSASVSTGAANVFDNGRISINTSSILATDNLTLSGPTPDLLINSTGTLYLRGGAIHDVQGGTLVLNAGGTIQFDANGFLGISGTNARFNLGRDLSVLNNVILQADNGGDIVSSSFIDVGNGGVGRMLIIGAGSTVTTAGTSDWGLGAAGSATVTIQGGGAGSLEALRIGTSDAAATVQLISGTLQTSSGFTMGGGTFNRNVSLGISGSSNLTINGVANFNNRAVVNLIGGSVNFNNDATFSTGSQLNWSGGLVNIASGRTLNVNGGTINNTTNGAALGNGATIRVTNGGKFDSNGFFDIANGNATGTLSVDGTGSRFTAQGTTDWGRNTGNAATVTFSNSGAGTLATLRMSDSGGASTLNLQTGGQLTTTSALITGNVSPLSTVRINIPGGALNSNGTANFHGGTNVNLSGGTLAFNNNATFSTSANLNWSGGTLQIASGRTLMFDGGAASLTLGGADLSDGATLRIGEFGAFESTSFVDIADSAATGTLHVDGVGARFRADGTSDWGSFAGNTATVTFSNFGVGTLNTLRLARFGGTANLSVGTNSTLTAATFEAGSAGGGALVQANSGTINVTGQGIFDNGANVSTSGTGVLRLGGNSSFFTGSTFNGTSSAANSGLQWADGTTLAFDGGAGSIAAIGSGVPNNGSLRITNGGSFTANENFNVFSGTQSLLVDGANSKLFIKNTTSTFNFWDGGTKTVEFTNSGAGTVTGGIGFANFGGIGTLNISTGGALTTGQMFVADNGAATININGATLRSTSSILIGRGTTGIGTINITGGGTLQADGGIFTTDQTATNRAVINVNGGTLRSNTNSNINGGATLNYSSGTVNIAGTLGVGVVQQNARVLLTPGGNKVLRVGGLNIPAVNGGKVDLSDNDMIIDYTGASPLGTIRGFLNTGRNGGNWLGNGLTSSVAATDPRTALGLVEATQLGSPATFFGQPIDNTTLLTRYTLYGDGNLDGTVNISDFAFLAANFNVATNSWFLGDYDYSGTTGIGDFALLASNFNLSLPTDLPRGGAVPEPGTLGLLGALAVTLQRRFRAKK